MIKFINVGVSFNNGGYALSNINAEISGGEFVYIIGRSGAGKSTLLRLIYADIMPTSGVVLIEGNDINSMARLQVPYLRRQVGVIFQDFKLLEYATVFDNVKLALDIFYMKRSFVRERIWELLKKVSIFEKRDDIVKNLSGGEKQRVAIARALVNDPKIILADEPTGNLDPETAENVMQILKTCRNSGACVIMATHDILLRNQHKAREIKLEKGRIVSDGVSNE